LTNAVISNVDELMTSDQFARREVADAFAAEEFPEGAAVDVSERLIGYHALRVEAVPREEGERSLEEGSRGRRRADRRVDPSARTAPAGDGGGERSRDRAPYG
jgi:hypothetical protein